MADLAPIVLILLAGTVGYAIYLWSKLAKTEANAKAHFKELEDSHQELEKTRKELKERREDAEQQKKLLQEARNKLKKQDKQPAAPPGAKRDRSQDAEAASPPSAAAVVRISDSQLEEQHRRAVEKLEAALAEAQRDLEEMKRKEAEMRREADKAARVLASSAESKPAPMMAAPTPPPASAPADDASLQNQLEAVKRAAVEREREMKRDLRRAQEAAASAQKRANNNHQLYQVIKGQLELLEDRLAALRVKYEGAHTLDEIRREQKRADRTRGASNGSGSAHPEPTPAPSTIEVSKEQIVAAEPVATEPPAPAEPAEEPAPVPEPASAEPRED